jgi:hypothetical protein
MTPQQKAQDLIEFFCRIEATKMSDYTKIYIPSANICALKVCEEVMSHMGADRGYEFWSKVKHHVENDKR